MKVLQVLLSPRIGGAETLVDQLNVTWARLGVNGRVAFLDQGADCVTTRSARWRRLRRQVDDFSPDVVLAHSALPNVYARLAARRGTPVVTVLHSADDDHANRGLWLAEQVLLFRTARVIAVSATQRDTYLAHFPRARPRTSVIPNGVRADLQPTRLPRPRPRTVGVLARITAQKRPDVWLRARDLVRAERPELRFVWWGSPARDEPGVQQLLGLSAESMGDSFPGTATSVSLALDDIDVYFHTADREAMSIALLEAAVSGLPIVCSDAVAATMPPGIPLDTFRVGDAEDAARVVGTVVDQHRERSVRAREIAPRLRLELGIESCAAAYVDLLDELTRQGPVGSSPPARAPAARTVRGARR